VIRLSTVYLLWTFVVPHAPSPSLPPPYRSGEAQQASHSAAMYTRAIEAASRSSGLAPAAIPQLAAQAADDADRLAYVHQAR
jgi:hypothetical protein